MLSGEGKGAAALASWAGLFWWEFPAYELGQEEIVAPVFSATSLSVQSPTPTGGGWAAGESPTSPLPSPGT